MRRTIGILATAAAISLAVVAPTPAQTPTDTTAAAATATALQITLLGQQLAVSQTQAAVGQNEAGVPFAAADGAALLLAGSPVPGAAPSAQPGGLPATQGCPLELDLNELTGGALSALQLEIACMNTSASNGDPFAARAESGEVVLRVLAPGGTVLEPLLGPVLAGLQQVTDPLVQALEPLLGIVTDLTQIDVPSVLDQLLNALGDDTFVLAEVVVAPSVSKASATSQDVSAEAGSNAVTINILPGIASTLDALTNLIDVPDTSGEDAALLQVKLGAANSRVVKNLDGQTVPDASAAQLLSITAHDSLGILQGLLTTVTDVLDILSIGALNCEDGALADILCIELGRVNELDQDELTARNMNFGPNTAGIESAAANIRVLPILADVLGGDVLGLSLAQTTAAANAVDVARVAPPGAPEVPAAAPLPKTGGESALPMTLALLAVGTAGVAMVRRARTV